LGYVAGATSNIQTQINNEVTARLNGDIILQDQISNLVSVTGSYALASDLAAKQNNITLTAGTNITIVESPTDTWTISASISGSETSSVGITGLNGISAIETSADSWVISGSPSYVALYVTSAGQSIPSGAWTKIVYGTKNNDPQNCVTTSSGVWYYTAKEAGLYLVDACIVYASNNWVNAADGEAKNWYLSIWHDTGGYELKRIFGRYMKNAAQNRYEVNKGSCLLNLPKDTRIHIRALHEDGANVTLLGVGNEYNYVNIRYMGGDV
jgi:hypothetical protein